jgi:Domain of Unknown Function (DUF1259)
MNAKEIFLVALFGLAFSRANASQLNIGKIDQLTGLKGKLNDKEGAYKVTFPRTDVKVTVGGWPIPPFMGLGTWASFIRGIHTEAMVMGDTVVFEDEVAPAMTTAIDNGLHVTALHNHFFYDKPKVFFMHIEGDGSVEQLATAVRKIYDSIEDVRRRSASPAESFSTANGADPLPDKNSVSAGPLNEIFGVQGEAKDGMVKFTFGRPATMHGVQINNTMGVNTWAAFGGTDDNAIVDGDFVVTEDELQPVLKTLVTQKLNIVAIHQHMTHEQPRMMFFHYWGRGESKALAQVIKGAFLIAGLQQVSSAK